MADPAYTPANTAHTSDHDPVAAIDHIPNRRLIIEAGKRARAEQERLERDFRLQDGRTPRGRSETDPPEGIFQ